MVTGGLTHAISVASRAYSGRTDRQGEPYVAHAIRVMLDVEGDEARSVAILHDVLEWGSITAEEFAAEAFPPRVAEAVDAMTSKPDEPLEGLIGRIRENELATTVKLADLRDNAQRWRLDAMPDPDTRERMLQQYRCAAELLGTSLDEICGYPVD